MEVTVNVKFEDGHLTITTHGCARLRAGLRRMQRRIEEMQARIRDQKRKSGDQLSQGEGDL